MPTKYQMISRSINALPVREWHVIGCSRNKVMLKYAGPVFDFEKQTALFKTLIVDGMQLAVRADGRAVAYLSGKFTWSKTNG